MTKTASWETLLRELIRRTSTDLPADVERRLRRMRAAEAPDSRARWVLDTILDNTARARAVDRPLCQDTGTPLFFVRAPRGFDAVPFESAARRAVAAATRAGWLRQNTIDTLSGRSIPDNVGAGLPAFYVEQEARRTVEVRLLLKGGGSENMGIQYSLPDTDLGAGRDWAGVRACLLDALVRAQGKGCAPGILGVCVGGDRGSGMAHAKRQLLRPIDDRAPDAACARLERQVLREAVELGIGPMGFGGKGAVAAVKIGTLARLPASYFVSVSYMCWACRRRGLTARPDGTGARWS